MTHADELRALRNGWLEGKGVAPTHEGLDWLAAAFDRHHPDDLPLPHLYPTAEGGVQIEWSLGSNEISVEVDLASHEGQWHRLDLATRSEDSSTLDLNDDGAWTWLAAEIRRHTPGEA